jgi:hypothetical protein
MYDSQRVRYFTHAIAAHNPHSPGDPDVDVREIAARNATTPGR